MDLFPAKSTFRPDEKVDLVTQDTPAGLLRVTRLGETVIERAVSAGEPVTLSPLPLGGYAATLDIQGQDTVAATAFDVLESPRQRPRYGFLSEFQAAREDLPAVADSLRRMHLNVVQFYDWAYRHEQLIPKGASDFVDPCGRVLSHATARDLIDLCGRIGALSLGYAAVYGVGHDYAKQHPDQLLYHHDGSPWSLADLLEIGNVAAGNPWRDHIIGQFAQAVASMGFDGLHLDTYGSPKIAWDAQGKPVDLAQTFPGFLEHVRAALPEATLYFNNVNDYPTWTSAAAPLNSTYIEVWDPHTDYAHLRSLILTAQLRAPARPVILAAYLTAFADSEGDGALWSARLALATAFAHGAHYLLCGEDGGVLTHPYYPNFARVDQETETVLRQYFDFAVAQGDLLYDNQSTDVTHAHFSSDENDDLAVSAEVPVAPDPLPGSVWATLRRSPHGSTVHLIDLSAQSSPEWNTAKAASGPQGGVTIRLRSPGAAALFGSPEAGPHLKPARTVRDGDHLVVTVPEFTGWGMVHVPDGHHWPTAKSGLRTGL